MTADCMKYGKIPDKYGAAFDLLYGASSDTVFVIDIDGFVAACNDNLTRKLHAAKREIIGKPLEYMLETGRFQTCVPDFKPVFGRLKNYIYNVFQSGRPDKYSEMIITENDELLYLNIVFTPVIEYKYVSGVIVSIRDITSEIRVNPGGGYKIAPWRECESEREFFIKTLLHDLKVPTLAQLRGVQLLQNRTLGGINSAQKEVLDEIVESCSYVLDMISTIICAYRFDNGEISLGCREILISDMLNDCRRRIGKDYKHPVGLAYEVYPENLSVFADARVLKTVIVNLILKIMTKYNPQKFVSIKAEGVGKFVRFIISVKKDSDFSKPVEWIPFKSLLQNLKFITVGYGIELYLCNKIISLHRGCAFVDMKDINIEQFLFEIPAEA